MGFFVPSSELGEHIKKLREALGGISQERFARRLGTTVRTIARWEAAEDLSPAILSRLHSIAQGAGAFELADFFEERLRADLDWQEGDSFGVDDAHEPGNADERQLVGELLRRYRGEDPAIQPFIEQLWAWMAERDAEIERDTKVRAALPKSKRNPALDLLETLAKTESEKQMRKKKK
jgi:transcriptional regulator with XRE-family HTH domain